MNINRNSESCSKITLSAEETAAIDRCHEILKVRYKEAGFSYNVEQKNRCEWWLLGILRFEGMESMVNTARTAPFHENKRWLIRCP